MKTEKKYLNFLLVLGVLVTGVMIFLDIKNQGLEYNYKDFSIPNIIGIASFIASFCIFFKMCDMAPDSKFKKAFLVIYEIESVVVCLAYILFFLIARPTFSTGKILLLICLLTFTVVSLIAYVGHTDSLSNPQLAGELIENWDD